MSAPDRATEAGIEVNPTSMESLCDHHSFAPLSFPGTGRERLLPGLDEQCPVKGFVSVTPIVLAWKDETGMVDVNLTHGVATSLHHAQQWQCSPK